MAQSIANRLRKLAGNRRQSRRRKTRRKARLYLHLPLFSDELHAVSGRRGAPLEGYTRDISTAGLALVVPSLPVDDEQLINEGSIMEITLELPGAPVRMRAVSVRCEPLANENADRLIAARITEIDEPNRLRLAEYLRRLRFSVGEFAP